MNPDHEEKARFLLDPPEETARKIHAVRHRSGWQEPLRLAIHTLSRENPQVATDLIRTAILAEPETDEFKKSAYEDILYRDSILAARLLADCETPDTSLGQELTEKLLGLEMWDWDIGMWRNGSFYIPPLRMRISQSLAELEKATGRVSVLLFALSQSKDHVFLERRQAIGALSNIEAFRDTAASTLVQVIQDREEREVLREDAITAIGNLQGPSQIVHPVLSSIIEDTSEISYTRTLAAVMLGKIDALNEAVVSVMLEILQDETEKHGARYRAILALSRAEVHRNVVVPVLINILRDGRENTLLPDAAAEALCNIGDFCKAEILALRKIIRPNLARTWFCKQETRRRRLAISVLGSIETIDDSTRALLLTVMQNRHEDKYVRFACIESMGLTQITSDAFVSALRMIAWKQNEDELIRAYALQTLVRIGEILDTDIPALTRIVDEDYNLGVLNQTAEKILARLGVVRENFIDRLYCAVSAEMTRDVSEDWELLFRLCQKQENEAPLPW
jgi:hypothetical protein